MTDNPFAERMAKLSDEKLLEIVGPLRFEYQPQAVEAAEAEIRQRQLNVDLGKIQSDAETQKEEEEKKKKSLITTTGSVFTLGLLMAITQLYRLSRHEKTATVVTNLAIIFGIALVLVFSFWMYNRYKNK